MPLTHEHCQTQALTCFNKAAKQYDAYSLVQKQVAHSLIDYTRAFGFPKKTPIADFCCGTGYLLKQLPFEKKIGIEAAPKLLEEAKKHVPDKTPLYPALSDFKEPLHLILSNLSLHWFEDIPSLLQTLLGTLKEPGHLIFSVAYPSSFKQFREALSASSLDTFSLPIDTFLTPNQWEGSLSKAGKIIHNSNKTYSISFSESLSILKHFKYTGTNTSPQHLSRGHLKKLDAYYKKLDQNPILTYDIGIWHLIKQT